VHYLCPGFDSELKILRNEIIKPGIVTVNVTPLDPSLRRKKHSLSHGSRKHLTPGLLSRGIPGIGGDRVGVFFLLAVASPENNGLAELLPDLNPNRDPCVKSFIMPLVMRKNSNKACLSAPASPVVTDDLTGAWLVGPEESGLRRKLAVVPEMSFYISATV